MIKSPLNYTGGKFKLLPQILPMFPKNVDNFYDLFCGGANVGANVIAKKVYSMTSIKKSLSFSSIFKKCQRINYWI